MNPISAKTIERHGAPLLSIETLRAQCEIVAIDVTSDGVESHPDDDLLLGYLDAAIDHAEAFTGRAISMRTLEFALDEFPRRATRGLQPAIEIPYPPFIEAISFTFGDDSDGELEEGVDYIVDDYGDKAALRPIGSWPGIVSPSPNRVKFLYRAGYRSEVDPDSDAPVLPGAIRAAILLTVEHLNSNRSATTEKAMAELPLGVDALLRPKRVLLGMA